MATKRLYKFVDCRAVESLNFTLREMQLADLNDFSLEKAPNMASCLF
jgi:hypothetical protein